jgi:ribosomal protein S18 acetylase RimI-like enzyme
VILRPATAADEDFLFTLYCSTRIEEMALWNWPPAQREAFLKMQFKARQHSYQAQSPHAENQLVQLKHQPIGRLLVARSQAEIDLMDIALLPEFRQKGIGTTLLRGLLNEASAAKQNVRLQVVVSNPAAHLYARLGFSKIGSDELYLEMEWKPSSTPCASAS